MDRLISMAWRALYVTVGACAVLVAQSVGAPDAVVLQPADPSVAPAVPSPRELRVSSAAEPAPSVSVAMPTGEAVPTAAHVRVGRWLSTSASAVPSRTAAQLSCAVGRARGSC